MILKMPTVSHTRIESELFSSGDEGGVKLSDPVMEPVQAEDGYHSTR